MLCECGCGRETKIGRDTKKPNRFIRGHRKKKLKIEKVRLNPSLCDFGCGRPWKYQFKNGALCCSQYASQCPTTIKKTHKPKGYKRGPNKKKMVLTEKETLRRKTFGIGNKWAVGGKGRKGQKATPEQREVNRQRSIDLWKDLDYRKRLSEVHKKPLSEEHRKSLKISLNKPETIEKNRIAQKKKWEDPKHREKMLQIHNSPETLERHSTAGKECWTDPEFLQKMADAVAAEGPNIPETIILNLLKEMYPGKWKYTGNKTHIIDRRNPDFTNKDQMKLIEHFGWRHTEEWNHIPREIHEKDRIDHFKKYGWDTLVIWYTELDDMKQVEEKIKQFVETNNA